MIQLYKFNISKAKKRNSKYQLVSTEKRHGALRRAESLYKGDIEAVLELRTEQSNLSRLRRSIRRKKGEQYRVYPVLVECRGYTLKLGGNAD